MDTAKVQELQQLQEQVETLKNQLSQVASGRFEEIREQITTLVREGKELADATQTHFYLGDVGFGWGCGGLEYHPAGAKNDYGGYETRTGWRSSSSDC